MNRVALKTGGGGVSLMRFTLIYDGLLPPNSGNGLPKKKWDIRAQLDPQLRQLWEQHPELSHLRTYSIVTKDGRYMFNQPHPLYPDAGQRRLHAEEAAATEPLQSGELDLCEPIRKGARTFFPLVRKTLAVTCGLRILFLRAEPRGRVLQSGDLDNRIKTLVDALGVPRDDIIYDNENLQDPVYCLLEDDALVTALDVRSEQLLAPTGLVADEEKEVRLIIEVDVRTSRPRQFNMLFSGD